LSGVGVVTTALKLNRSACGEFIPLPVSRHGYCNFTTNEVLGAFFGDDGPGLTLASQFGQQPGVG
jgi:hypothetical protein